jgi:hypothetical protein
MSSETGKRNPDRLNTLGVVVVGVCGAVLVYVSIALLQAFYMNDTAQVEVMADYGGQDMGHRSIKSEQIGHIDPGQGVKNPGKATFSIKIDRAIDLVVEAAKQDPAMLVPSQGRSDKATIQPYFGRPKKLDDAAKPHDASCDEVSCVLSDFEGACCAKFKPPAGSGTGSAGSNGP